MGKLKTVTISGADDKVRIDDLVALSKKFPFVEWGILMSPVNHGKPRYPSVSWLIDIGLASEIKKSVHLCGDYARLFAIETSRDIQELNDIINDFHRCQINLGSQLNSINPELLATSISKTMVTEYILQMPNDAPESITVLDKINHAVQQISSVTKVFPFLDGSAGKGITESKWQMNVSTANYRGYAGGINPGNVELVIKTISAGLHKNQEFWIDMESGVRTNNEFDLKLVENVLAICESHMAVA